MITEACESQSLRRSIRALMRRQWLDDMLDWVRFRLDTFPRSVGWLRPLGLPEMQSATYHELPWVGLTSGRRANATVTRWDRMRPVLERLDVHSALDLGANAGGFTFRLAALGIPTIGVDNEYRNIRVAHYARRKLGNQNASFVLMDLTPASVRSLPDADATLLLSVWHHFVRDVGFDDASAMLRGIWDRTRCVLFFDTGEDEMPASWGLPAMLPDGRTWLEEYLAKCCPGSEVVHLGDHDALGPNNEPCRRNLFAIIRSESAP